jgi:hypothetical protein
MYHAVTEGGEELVFSPPAPDKDTSVAMVRALFVIRKVVRYVFIDEAWLLEAKGGLDPADLLRAARKGISGHPDRREVLLLNAEDRHGGHIMGRRYILRPEHGKPKLSPMTILGHDETAGRMVGLLQPI